MGWWIGAWFIVYVVRKLQAYTFTGQIHSQLLC
jgi:hypothetical protein